MSKPGQGPRYAEEVLLHIRVYTTQLSVGHLKPVADVSADLGLEKPPEFTRDEMERIMFVAKGEAIRILMGRGRRVRRKRARVAAFCRGGG